MPEVQLGRDAGAALEATRHLEAFEIKKDHKLPPVSLLPKAFGEWSFGEISKVLDKENKLRDQGLDMLFQINKRPTDLIRAAKAGLIARLRGNLDNPKSFACLEQFARQRYSRMEITASNENMEALFQVAASGPELKCRIGAFVCLTELSRHPGLSKEHKSAIVTLCISSSGKEAEPAAKVAALKVLKTMIIRQNVNEQAETCIPVVTELLEHKDTTVRKAAVETLQYVCVTPLGKAKCIEAGSVTKLCSNLKHDDKSVRLPAGAALMGIANLIAGKKAIAEAGGVGILMERLDDKDDIKNYALQALTNLFSNETIRHQVKATEGNVTKIRSLTKSQDPIIAYSAALCLDKILWEA
mmetsp:Transcript_16121/g.28995  ORF Transcript_16121/g.28995 Transcript_16121/m.28995 type:complete len:356 (+) Transcript_16121:120-1187(+)|eukprot:CAMPEP_0197526538 /NCGR_PEP_ID=MMETSP1318-20131121/18096_1 /TAXON_ID=552666 /ORGANISM="Partenskyella glossopodia, Strain RCC365" /LENGTH=355 /DNA_ID=CAMNT_0043080729 /DNA_START=100 /DNA_END=1167 /DNA_ORIENTATION=-